MNTSKFQWLNLSDEDLTDPSLSMEDLLGFSIHLYHYPKELHPIETMYDCWENLKNRDKETFGLLERVHAIQTGWYLAYSFYRLSDIDHAKEACQYAYSLTDTDLLAGDRISSLLLSAVISSFCQEAAQTEKSLEEVRYLLSQRSDKVDGLNFEYEVVAMRFALSQNDLPAAQKHEKMRLALMIQNCFRLTRMLLNLLCPAGGFPISTAANCDTRRACLPLNRVNWIKRFRKRKPR